MKRLIRNLISIGEIIIIGYMLCLYMQGNMQPIYWVVVAICALNLFLSMLTRFTNKLKYSSFNILRKVVFFLR